MSNTIISKSKITQKIIKVGGGRPRKTISNKDDETFKEFLALFNLKDWTDTQSWTRTQLIDNGSIKKYFELRPKLLKLSFPLNEVRKIKIVEQDKFTVKDLITLLNQFGKLFGYHVNSYTKDVKPTKYNGMYRKQCHQVYTLGEMVSTTQSPLSLSTNKST